MTIRSDLCPIACRLVLASATLAMATATPVLAAQECLANGKSFQVGQVACLTLGDESHLARCEMVLNNTSWTKIHDDCPATKPPPVHPTSISTPAPGRVPAEPTEN